MNAVYHFDHHHHNHNNFELIHISLLYTVVHNDSEKESAVMVSSYDNFDYPGGKRIMMMMTMILSDK
jgi:hypothetical protein